MMAKVPRKPPKIYQALKNGNGIATMVVLEFGSGDVTDHRKGRFDYGSEACLLAYSHLRTPRTTLVMADFIKANCGGATCSRAAGRSII